MISKDFLEIADEIKSGLYGNCDDIISEMLTNICNGIDPYLLGVDFDAYIKAEEEIERVFGDKHEFCRRTMKTMSIVGHVSVDKTITELCEKVWKIPSMDVPKPSQKPDNRVRSSTNLLAGINHSQFSNDNESHDGMSMGSNDPEQAAYQS